MGILKVLRKIKDPGSQGHKRSPEWEEVRKAHLEKFPACAVSGKTKKDGAKLEVHHIKQFSKHPELELDPDNLITLARKCSFGNMHILFGHGGNFKQENPNVVEDAKHIFDMLQKVKLDK